jgi:hypothetical protein
MWQTEYGITRIKPAKQSQESPSLTKGLSNLCRIQAELKVRKPAGPVVPIQQKIIPARLILCDFRETWIGLFTPESVQVGTEVAFTIEKPKRFFCVAQVTSCVFRTDASRVISTAPYDYRLNLRILFQTADEARLVASFVQALNTAQMTPMGIYSLDHLGKKAA